MKGSLKRKYKKTIEALLYIMTKERRLYWILKSIWLAERNHLEKYASMILGDKYIAMSKGPVPSFAYDIIKDARGDNLYGFHDPTPSSVIEAESDRIMNPLRRPDLSILNSEERKSLDEAISFLAPLSFQQVRTYSHTEAYNMANQNDEIPFEAFVLDLENGEEIIDFLNSD